MNYINPNILPTVPAARRMLGRPIARLASGQRINSGQDDPAGLAVRAMFLSDLASVRQASRNTMDGISLVQTADSAAGAVGDNLVRMRQLANGKFLSGTLSAQQKRIIQQEFDELVAQNAWIADASRFNGIKLFAPGQSIDIAVGDGDAIRLKTDSIVSVSGSLLSDAPGVLAQLNAAIDQVNGLRAGFGATANRLETAYAGIRTEEESIVGAHARLSHTDVAGEMAALNSNHVLTQAALAANAQANVDARIALQLLN